MTGEAQTGRDNTLAQVLDAVTPLTLPELSVSGQDELVATEQSPVEVRIELGRTRLATEQVHGLVPGGVVQLDETIGDPVRVYADGRLRARGEMLVLEERLCVRVTQVFP